VPGGFKFQKRFDLFADIPARLFCRDTGNRSLVAEDTAVGTAGVRQKNGDDKRSVRVGFCCQIVILGACFMEGVKSASLEERFTIGALRFKSNFVRGAALRAFRSALAGFKQ